MHSRENQIGNVLGPPKEVQSFMEATYLEFYLKVFHVIGKIIKFDAPYWIQTQMKGVT